MFCPGSLKSTTRSEDEVLNQILGHDREKSFFSGNQSTNDLVLHSQRPVDGASSSSTKGPANLGDGGIQKTVSNDGVNNLGVDVGSTSPDDLRKKALEEKKKYKILKGDGKPEEALRAFKRGKELERQADALEVHLRKTRKKISSSGNLSDVQNRDNALASDKKTKSLPHIGKEKPDLTAELRELGWSDLDLRDEDKKSANLSLEGELSSIIGEITPKTSEERGSRIDKTQVVALKKKALMLKREGKLAEAKEELKKAKVLEKQLEEQEFLAEAEDSDDELSALIRGMDNDREGSLTLNDQEHGFDFGNLLVNSDNLDSNLEVTDEDMMDPEMAAALESLGWTNESNYPENTSYESQPPDTEALHSEIQSLKREALKQKREGNSEEAMAFLKKAKLLERDLKSPLSQESNTMVQKAAAARKGANSRITGEGSDLIQFDGENTSTLNAEESIMVPKSRLMIQKELLSLKKKALALRREGKLNEAEEELRKGAVLEHQLDEMGKASNLKVIGGNVPRSAQKLPNIHRDLPFGEEGEEEVTDQDLSDPTYLSLLKDLGWNDYNNEPLSSTKNSNKDEGHSMANENVSVSQQSTNILVGEPRRSKFEIQRELLGLKRKALALRREGKVEEAEEMLKMAKELENKIAEMEAPKKEVQVEAITKENLFSASVGSAVEERNNEAFFEEDMHDPAMNSMLTSLGRKDEELEQQSSKEEPAKNAGSRFTHMVDLSVLGSSGISGESSRSKSEIQRELLVLKRKALALKRKGEREEAEKTLRIAKSLEEQMEEIRTDDKEFHHDVSNYGKPIFSESSDLPETHGSTEVALEVDHVSASSVVNPLSNEVSPSNETKTIGYSTSSHQEILAHKRRAVALKREGKLAEAREELRQAKLLEKSLENDKMLQNTASNSISASTSNTEQEKESLNTSVKLLTSRDRFKLQQESLGHKRQALRLRREGRMEEAEAEFERAKALEIQLEEHDSGKSSNNTSDATEDVTVEDFLDPQLLSALKAVGLEDFGVVSRSPEKQEPVKSDAAKVQSFNQERIQLEERIKAEKVKAVNLKRSGKQAEALDALRLAKLYEKKLNSLTSGTSE